MNYRATAFELLLLLQATSAARCTLPWEQVGADLTGENTANEMGRSVALSADGRTMAVGEPNWGWEALGARTGRVWTYALDEAEEWFETTAWEPFGARANSGALYINNEDDADFGKSNGFGYSVALSSDGRTLVVGMPYKSHDLVSGSCRGKGAVRVYTLSESGGDKEWNPLGKMINGQSCGDNFGWSVAVTSDGRTVAVGAPNADAGSSSSPRRGYTRVYSYDEGEDGWVQSGHQVRGEERSENFGWSVSISGDGRILAVGNNIIHRPTVRVYYYKDGEEDGDTGGSSEPCIQENESCADGGTCCEGLSCWTRGSTKRCSEDIFSFVEQPKGSWNRLGNDLAGETVSLSSDGRTLAIGNPDVTGKVGWNSYRSNSGAVQVYYYQSEKDVGAASSGWTRLGKDIIGENEKEYLGDTFGGRPVAISGDGMTVVVGSSRNVPREDDGDSSTDRVNVGHARVYSYDPDDDDWHQVGIDMDGRSSEDKFGDAVAVSYDGKVVAIGARQDKNLGENIPDFVRGSGYARAFMLPESCLEPVPSEETIPQVEEAPASSPVSSMPEPTYSPILGPEEEAGEETPTSMPTPAQASIEDTPSDFASQSSAGPRWHWKVPIGGLVSCSCFSMLLMAL